LLRCGAWKLHHGQQPHGCGCMHAPAAGGSGVRRYASMSHVEDAKNSLGLLRQEPMRASSKARGDASPYQVAPRGCAAAHAAGHWRACARHVARTNKRRWQLKKSHRKEMGRTCTHTNVAPTQRSRHAPAPTHVARARAAGLSSAKTNLVSPFTSKTKTNLVSPFGVWRVDAHALPKHASALLGAYQTTTSRSYECQVRACMV
jgi:hypothetical protein